RAEMLFERGLLNQLQTEGWYSFGLYLPSDGFMPDDDEEILSQWHDSGSPYLSLRVVKDRFKFKSDKENVDIDQVTKDVWHQFVFHIRQSTGSNGLVEVWHNGEKVVSRTGKTAH